MNLQELQENWHRLGSQDPLWAVLSHRDKRDNQWDTDAFLATGRELIAETVDWLHDSGIETRGRALDFGCGAGRLTQALADHFDAATGVDIAASMVTLAEDLAKDREDCAFVVNTRPDLRVFEDASFDCVCSYIVLQHMEPRYAEAYLREFARILKPGGTLVFQLPSEPHKGFQGLLRRLLSIPVLQRGLNAYKRWRLGKDCAMEMYGIPVARVRALLTELGLEVRDQVSCTSAGPRWQSFRYLASKSTAPVGAPHQSPAPASRAQTIGAS